MLPSGRRFEFIVLVGGPILTPGGLGQPQTSNSKPVLNSIRGFVWGVAPSPAKRQPPLQKSEGSTSNSKLVLKSSGRDWAATPNIEFAPPPLHGRRLSLRASFHFFEPCMPLSLALKMH